MEINNCPNARYKVWVQVELVDECDDHEIYDNIGLPDSLGSFESFAQAAVFIRTLAGWVPPMANSSDYREDVPNVSYDMDETQGRALRESKRR